MNRKWKFTGFVLASALLLGSTGTFLVGCKDYDDDISHLQQQIDANKKAIEGIEAQIKAGAILTKVESDGAGGVKVTLSNGQTYHIEKGAKGEDGAQGIQGPEAHKARWVRKEMLLLLQSMKKGIWWQAGRMARAMI